MEAGHQTEKRILSEARKIFQEKGYSGTRMQEIADQSGVNKALVHYYFRNKESLFQTVFEEVLAEFLPVISAFETAEVPWEEKVEQFISDIRAFAQSGSLLFLVREIKRSPELIKRRSNRPPKNLVVQSFQKWMDEGLIRKADPNLLYIFIISLSTFPSVNEKGFRTTLRLSGKEYANLMQHYHHAAAQFFVRALQVNTNG